MANFSKRLAVVNTFGSLGYISLILQWAWGVLIVAYPFITSGAMVKRVNHPVPTVSGDFGAFNPLVTFIAICTALLVLIATVMTLIKLPKTVGKTGARVTHQAAAKTTKSLFKPKHAPLPEKKRIEMSHRLVLAFKLIAMVTPLAMLLFTKDIPLDTAIMWAIGVTCAMASLLSFTFQELLARIVGVKLDAIW